MNSMKRQKDKTLKGELHRSVSAQNAIEDQWENNSRKNEEREPKAGHPPKFKGVPVAQRRLCKSLVLRFY